MVKRRKCATVIVGVILALMPPVEEVFAQSRVRANQDAQSRRGSALRKTHRAIDRIIGQPQFATTRWGILIESVDRKLVVFRHDSDQLFTPASNMKLYTTAAALDTLGPKFRFRTSVYAGSPPDAAGVVTGDLILFGRGDPNLSSEATGTGGPLTPLEDLAEQIWRAGVREIRGNVVGDESFFSGPHLGAAWEWDDLQWAYGAEISALSVDDNTVALAILPGGAPGQPAKVLITPETTYVTITNSTMTAPAGSRQDLGIHRGLETNAIEIWGQVPVDGPGFRGYIAIHDPPLYAASLLTASLRRRGVKITGGVARAGARDHQDRPLNVTPLSELAYAESIPLSEELRILNKISQNLHTELLLRAIAGDGATSATPEKGIEAIQRFLQKAKARRQGIAIHDGSGLSRHNLVTPATTVDLLRFMDHHPFRDVFLRSLPVAGVDGTLESRMGGTRAGENLRAKTGTLRFTSSLSGYVQTADGERLVFSIMSNNHTGPLSEVLAAINEIGALLAEAKLR